MNAQSQITHTDMSISIKTAQLITVLAFTLGGQTNHVLAADDYYEKALTNPSEAVLRAEARGRVTIYDGLEHRIVDQALDTQFQRIDNMVFVRTRETESDDSVDVDDDCNTLRAVKTDF